MSNFSDFFPAAGGGGGGGFTKRLKYTRPGSTGDADFDNANTYTVNPATDLGLEDGASLGYFMVGGGTNKNNTQYGGNGGYIIQGIVTITNASTNLTLTPAEAASTSVRDTYTHSTITGGITLTTADGDNGNGWGATGATGYSGAGPGINGYGVGAMAPNRAGELERQGSYPTRNGFGSGGSQSGRGGDGAIILFY
jgi:hypothetical protein